MNSNQQEMTEKINSQKAMFEHQMNELRKRNQELEEQINAMRCETTGNDLQSEKSYGSSQGNPFEPKRMGSATRSASFTNMTNVLELQELNDRLQKQLDQQEQENYEYVAILKEEAMQLRQQLKVAQKNKSLSDQDESFNSMGSSDKVDREKTQLYIENDKLKNQVEELKKQLGGKDGSKSEDKYKRKNSLIETDI